MNLFGWLKGVLAKVFAAAQANGLTDKLINEARTLAEVAARDLADNTSRREWVVQALVASGTSESLARFALEAAIQLLKKKG